MRVYIPATLSLVRAWRSAGEVPASASAYAVTSAVIEAVEGDAEEQEFAVTVLAADESLVLLAGAPDDVQRRVVLVLDATAEVVDGAEVRLMGAIELSHLDAVLIDDPANTAAVTNAVVDAAPELLDDAVLLWFAADELDDVLK